MSISNILSEILHNIQLTKYFSAIGFTIVTYDTFLTLADEIRLVRPERWNLVKTLFYANRIISYIFIAINAYHLSGFAPLFTDSFCQILILTTGYGAIFTFAMTNWLLLTRAMALWGGTRTVVWTMTLFYLLTYIATITIATISSRSLVGNIFYLSATRTCAASFRPNTFGAIWVPSILFDLVLFGMLFVKIWQHAHRMTGGARSRLLKILHRDGFIYFIVILGLRIFNLIAWATLDISLIFIGIFILWAFTTVLLTRMHLNLKSIARNPTEREEGEEEDIFDTTISFKHSTVSNPPQVRTHTPLHRLPSNSSRAPSRARRKGKAPRYDNDIGAVSTNIFPGGTHLDPNENMYDYMTARSNTGAGDQTGNRSVKASSNALSYDRRYDESHGGAYSGYDDVFDGSQTYHSHMSHINHLPQLSYAPQTSYAAYTPKTPRMTDSPRTFNTNNSTPTIRSLEPRPVLVTVTVDRSIKSERISRLRHVDDIV